MSSYATNWPSPLQAAIQLSVVTAWAIFAGVVYFWSVGIVFQLLLIVSLFFATCWQLHLVRQTCKKGNIRSESINWQLVLISYVVIKMPLFWTGLRNSSKWSAIMNITELRATSLAIFIFLNVVVYQNGRQFSLETSVFWAWIWRYNALTAAATFCSICVAFFYPSSGLVDLIIQMIGTLQFGQLGIVVLLILAIYLRNRISSDKPERMIANLSRNIGCLALAQSVIDIFVPMAWIGFIETDNLYHSKPSYDNTRDLRPILSIVHVGFTIAVIAQIPKLAAAEQKLAEPLPQWAVPTTLEFDDDDYED